jgi:hypothetical protein
MDNLGWSGQNVAGLFHFLVQIHTRRAFRLAAEQQKLFDQGRGPLADLRWRSWRCIRGAFIPSINRNWANPLIT